MAHTYNRSAQEAKDQRSTEVHDRPGLHFELHTTLCEGLSPHKLKKEI